MISMIGLGISLLKFLVRLGLTLIYRPRLVDFKNLPKSGPALIACNHVSYLDGLLIYCYSPRPIRFIADKDYIPKGIPMFLARQIKTILIEPGNPWSIVKMIREAREAFKNGEILCIFPEGGITRTGQMRAFEPGFLAILKGCEDVPVLPAFIGGLWGSVFSYTKPTDERRRPRRLLQRLTIAFGEPIVRPKSVYPIQRAVEELGVDAMDPARFPRDRHYLIPTRQMLRALRGINGKTKAVDTTGKRMSAREILLSSLVARRVLRRILNPKNQNIGLLLPTSVGGMLANAALSLDKKVPINLNFTMGNETLDYCCDLTGIEQILTSKRFLQKFPKMKLKAEMIMMEDALKKIPLADKLAGFLESLLPTWILERWLGLTQIKPNDTQTIVFTSGSTGRPKGAILSQMNVASNVHQFYNLFRPSKDEKILGALPFFHSFGFTTTIWCPLMCSVGAAYHYSPLDAKVIGELSRKENAGIIPSTATFFRNYLRRCPKEHFENATTIVAGAEKLPHDLMVSWREKFGQQMVEGFGATELSPVLAANLQDCRRPDTFHIYCKEGSIGIPLGGLAVRITDPVTGKKLGANEPGMLEVKGPTVMMGYYNDPKRTAESIHDGWYSTGDIAKIDDDGFIFITGRLSRISKIGGEMVPHVLIEEEIEKILQKFDALAPKETGKGEDDFVALRIAVTAVPDAKKGEKIVVLHTQIPATPEEIGRELQNAGFPQLWIPAPQNFRQVDAIPMLGTGKPSLKEIRDKALAIEAAEASEA